MASGGIELPRIDGFLFEDRPGLIAPRMRNMFATILGCKHFSRRIGASPARFYINLVVLYRMLLFYGDLRATPEFWNNVRNDWGLTATVSARKVVILVNYFTDARLRSMSMGYTFSETLLMRLAARWAELRAGRARLVNVDAAWAPRRGAWVMLRDTDLNTLLDPSRVLCSLEAQDPLGSSMARDEATLDKRVTEWKNRMRRVHEPEFMDYLERRQQGEQHQHHQHNAVRGEAAAAAMGPLDDPHADYLDQLAERIDLLEERLDEEMRRAIAVGTLSNDAQREMLQKIWSYIASITGDVEAMDMAMEY